MAKALTERIIVITGGSSGIGATLARALAARGAAVAVVASSDRKKADIVVDDIEAAGGRAISLVGDVRDATVASSMVAETKNAFGRFDMLANAAGVFLPSPPGDTPQSALDAMVDINIKGTWNMLDAAVEPLKANGGGKVLNFSSCAGVQGIKSFAIYCATKAAISMMTRVVGAELAPFNINVNAIAPGNTATPMNEAVRTDPAMAEAYAAMEQLTPSNTTFSDAEDIAHAAIYLLSDAARPMYGSSLLIDEGISAVIG